MMRREVLTRLREGSLQGDRGQNGNRINDMHLELDSADHEEPTWEVRRPGDAPRKRLDRRTRAILGIAAAAAVVVNAGAAWVYWQITESGTGQASSGAPVELALRGRSDLADVLRRGEIGNLTVNVANDNDYPIQIQSVAAGTGNIVADPEHRDAGCTEAAVTFSRPRFDVRWDVQRNTIGAFTIAGALSMRKDAQRACDGATFTVPVRASGVRRNAD
jgi:hypothetical protein